MISIEPAGNGGACLACNLSGAKHWSKSMKQYIHAICALEWLKTPDGLHVVAGGDSIMLNFGIEV